MELPEDLAVGLRKIGLDPVSVIAETGTSLAVLAKKDRRLYVAKMMLLSTRARKEMRTSLVCAGFAPQTDAIEWEEAVAQIRKSYLVPVVQLVNEVAMQKCGLLSPYLGPDLRHVMAGAGVGGGAGGNMPVLQVLQVVRDVAFGLGQCHARRYVHLDVKPGNIVVDEETGSAYVIDFSLTRKLSKNGFGFTEKSWKAFGGTPAYMAPEQSGKLSAPVDFRADLYSLGCVLYELLCGHSPFQRDADDSSPAAMMVAHVARKVPPLPDHVPQPVQRVVMKLLEKTPSQRYSSARSLVDDLDAFLAAKGRWEELEGFVPDEVRRFMQPLPLRRLYGRDQSVGKLVQAVLNVNHQSRSQLLVVAGASGTGKSALVREAERVVTSLGHGSIFLSGKFLQLDHTPYFGVAAAVDQLEKKVNALPFHVQEKVRGVFEQAHNIEAMGELGGLSMRLVDLVSDLSSVPISYERDGGATAEENRARLHHAFLRLLSLFRAARSTVVLFLDDLQWADSCTFALIQAVLNQPGSPTLLLGAYRDNNLDDSHPLSVLLAQLSNPLNELVEVHTVRLGPCTLHDVVSLTRDIMQAPDVDPAAAEPDWHAMPRREVEALAEQVIRHTNGNPFFTIQFLYSLFEDELLHYDWARRRWVYSPESVAGAPFTDNVVDFLVSRLQQLPPITRDIVGLLALSGLALRTDALANACVRAGVRLPTARPHLMTPHQPPPTLTAQEELVEALWTAVQPALDSEVVQVVREDSPLPPYTSEAVAERLGMRTRLMFVHDRIEEGALHLLEHSDRELLHFAVGVGLAIKLQLAQLCEIDNDDDDDGDGDGDEVEAAEEMCAWEEIEAELPLPTPTSFSMVEHLFQGVRCIDHRPSSVRALLLLSVSAAKLAASSFAFEQASRCLQNAIELAAHLQEAPWYEAPHATRTLLWKLHLERAYASIPLVGSHVAAELFALCERHAVDAFERAQVKAGEAIYCCSRELYQQSLDAGVAVAKLLGNPIPELALEDVAGYIRREVLTPIEALRARARGGPDTPIVQVIPEPAAPSREVDVLERAIYSIVPAAYMRGTLSMYVVLGAHLLTMALRRGYTTETTAAGMAVLGTAMAAVGLEMEGAALSAAGTELMHCIARRPDLHTGTMDAETYMHTAMSCHWVPNMHPSFALFDTAFSCALSTGNHRFGAYAHTFYLTAAFTAEHPLPHVVREFEERDPFVARVGLMDMHAIMSGIYYAAVLLHDPHRVSQAELTRYLSQPYNAFADLARVVYPMFALFLLERYTEARELLAEVTPDMLARSVITGPYYEFHWTAAVVSAQWLAVLAKSPQHPTDADRSLPLRHFLECYPVMHRCASLNPPVWEPKFLLVHCLGMALLHLGALGRDEICAHAALQGTPLHTLALEPAPPASALTILGAFERTIHAAHHASLFAVEALAAREAAALCLELQPHPLPVAARGYVDIELRAWRAWGATAVVTARAAREDRSGGTGWAPQSISSSEESHDSQGRVSNPSMPQHDSILSLDTVSSSALQNAIDVRALLSAARAVSSQLEVPGVILSFLTLMEESSGSQRTAVILRRKPASPTLERRPSKLARRSSVTAPVELKEYQLEVIREEGAEQWLHAPLHSSRAHSSVPLSIIRHVSSTWRALVLTDARCDERVKVGVLQDQYFEKRSVLSAMVVPLLHNNALLGFVYLENNLAAGVFDRSNARFLSLICAQFGVSLSNAQLFTSLQEQHQRIAAAHAASTRFVPASFLKRIGRANTMEARLGDAVELRLTVLFTDVRGFTTISEGMGAKEVFRFLNRILDVVVPAVIACGGTVDKVIGDGTMCLFERPHDAVQAARSIQLAIRQLNRRLLHGSSPALQDGKGRGTGDGDRANGSGEGGGEANGEAGGEKERRDHDEEESSGVGVLSRGSLRRRAQQGQQGPKLSRTLSSEEKAWPSLGQVQIGVGIHTGNVLLGCLGTEQRLDASGVGDTVNLASRVEGLTKRMRSSILVTEVVVREGVALADPRHECGAGSDGVSDGAGSDGGVSEVASGERAAGAEPSSGTAARTAEETQGAGPSCEKERREGSLAFLPFVRSLGSMRVQGKSVPIAVFQLFERPSSLRECGAMEEAEMVERAVASRPAFYRALTQFERGNFEAAHLQFKVLCCENPLDSVLHYFLDECKMAAPR